MRSKSDTRTPLKTFSELVETNSNPRLKSRTDNGHGFDMKEYFASKGTLPQVSYVERPQQNGAVERKQQHILNVATALRFQANLPLSL